VRGELRTLKEENERLRAEREAARQEVMERFEMSQAKGAAMREEMDALAASVQARDREACDGPPASLTDPVLLGGGSAARRGPSSAGGCHSRDGGRERGTRGHVGGSGRCSPLPGPGGGPGNRIARVQKGASPGGPALHVPIPIPRLSRCWWR
jgi:hypothetical protein